MNSRDYDLRAYRLVDGVIREIPLPARELFDGKAFNRRCDAEDAREIDAPPSAQHNDEEGEE